MLAVKGPRKVEAAVTYALKLRNLPEHRTYRVLALRAKTSLGNFVQVVRNLYFHVVAYALILLDTRIKLVEVVFVLNHKQLRNEREHPAASLGKEVDFLARLEKRKLGSGEQAA